MIIHAHNLRTAGDVLCYFVKAFFIFVQRLPLALRAFAIRSATVFPSLVRLSTEPSAFLFKVAIKQ